MKYLVLLFLSLETFGEVRNKLHTQEYLYDFSVSGGASSTTGIELSAISGKEDLPLGAIVVDVHYKVLTALTSSGNASWTAGFVGDSDAYIDDQNKDVHGVDNYVGSCATALGAACWDDTNDNNIPLLADSADETGFVVAFTTHPLTAGKILFWVDYYMPTLD